MKSLLSLFTLLACSGEKSPVFLDTGAPMDPLSWSVEAPGPYQVGYQSWDHTYALGSDLGDRQIRIHLWYPTEETSGPVGEYTVGTDPNVLANAQMASPIHERGYPVLVHSHGDLDLGTGSAFLSRHMSSHGWASVSMDHTGNTLLDITADPQAANFFHRPLDVRAALDAVDDFEPLGGLADTSRVVLSGHSRGAYTTWSSLGATYDMESVEEMCSTGDGLDGDPCTPAEWATFQTELSDPRVVATIPLDGAIRRAWFGLDGEATVRGPVLYFSPEDSEGSQAQFDNLAPIDFRWVTLAGACHQSFANGGCSSLDTDEGFRIVSALGLAFSRTVLFGDSGLQSLGLLNGDIELSDIVSIHHR